MVVKLISSALDTGLEFESRVILDGSQTVGEDIGADGVV